MSRLGTIDFISNCPFSLDSRLVPHIVLLPLIFIAGVATNHLLGKNHGLQSYLTPPHLILRHQSGLLVPLDMQALQGTIDQTLVGERVAGDLRHLLPVELCKEKEVQKQKGINPSCTNQ